MSKRSIAPIMVFAVVVFAFVYYYCAVQMTLWPFLDTDIEKKGQFGDAFGVFTSLFSALGFGGVLLTLWIQRKSAKTQSFETTLFQMLSLQNTIIQDLNIHKYGSEVVIRSGRSCFRRYYVGHLKPSYRRMLTAHPTKLEGEIVDMAFSSMYAKTRHNLGHYFRFTYNIFRFIHEADIEDDLKLKYSRIIRSQLSDFELLLLFYNCLHRHGVDRFKPLVEHYCLFNNLPTELLLNDDHRQYYAESAYTQVGLKTEVHRAPISGLDDD